MSNHDDDGSKNVTNMQRKTVVLHALHVHFSVFDISKLFSFFPHREIICIAVVWTTRACDDIHSVSSSYF